MNLSEFEAEFAKLGDHYKTADVSRLNRALIKNQADVSFLADLILEKQQYHRTFFHVSLAQLSTIEEKLAFIETHFDKLQDWWHVDQLSQAVDHQLTFDIAYEKAAQYVKSDLPFVRRWGYVMFMPTLVKQAQAPDKLFPLLHDDDEYYVQMAQAWLISYLAIHHPERTLAYLAGCPLRYNIAGKAIQKICDSYQISNDTKARFKTLRKNYK